ncbi:MAG: carboxy-S-adenosyl-L-methionine synthase CmoA [Pseudomonadota bacterium]
MTTGSAQDRVFAKRLKQIKSFEFDQSVADVFQDMISRSVPGYPVLMQMTGLFADIFVQPKSRVYDLGCSLGVATRIISKVSHEAAPEIIAIDNSIAMIEKCREDPFQPENVEWICDDIQKMEINNASMVVLNLTLQFLPPQNRDDLIRKIWEGLNPGGILFLSEKVELDDELENDRMVELYQAFKKSRGYSELEISQKRAALEKVLIPDTPRQHSDRLEQAGFSEVYECFRCFNFCAYLAIK